MTPMLEKIARAIEDAMASDDNHPHDIARAALLAMRDEAPTRAMAESQASDDEGAFEPMCDLLGFSGENKTRTVLRQAWVDAIDAILAQPSTPTDVTPV